MAAQEANSWDVIHDLQFLIASDDQLQDELTHVCDLLDSEPSFQEEYESSPQEKKRRVRDYHHKAELAQLRQEVERLKVDLQLAKIENSTFDMSAWERAAKRERVEKQRSMQENTELRAAVDERATFIQQMKRTLCRKPRWNSLPDANVDEWQSYKLAAKQSLRVTAIHAIADRQYRRQHNAFIQAGIFDRTEDLFRSVPIPLSNNRILLQVINHVNFAAPFRTVSGACWNTFSGDSRLPIPENASETIDIIDEFTVYERFAHTQGGITGHSNNIRKYYQEENRDVIVWRTVLEDALVPHMTKGAVDDTWGWLVVTPHPEHQTKCRMTCLVQIPLDPLLIPHFSTIAKPNRNDLQTMDAITAAIQALSFPSTSNTDSKENTFPCPAMRTFLERGRLFEMAMKKALNDAISHYSKSN